MLMLKLKIFWWKLFGKRAKNFQDFLGLMIANKDQINQVFIQIQSKRAGDLSEEIIHIIAHHRSGYKIIYHYNIPELCDDIDFCRVLLRAVEFEKYLKKALVSTSVYLLDDEGKLFQEEFIRWCRNKLEKMGIFFPDATGKRQWI